MAIHDHDYIGRALPSDPYDERPGLRMLASEMTALKALPEGTWLQAVLPNDVIFRFSASDENTLAHLPHGTRLYQDGLVPDPKSETVWLCKIGVSMRLDLPQGSDLPMRKAVKAAFEDLTGGMADFCFSGWGGSLSIAEQVVVGQAKMDETRYLYPGPGGALMSSHEIEGLTQDLSKIEEAAPDTPPELLEELGKDSCEYYGGRWIICETMGRSAQQKIAEALGVSYRETPL